MIDPLHRRKKTSSIAWQTNFKFLQFIGFDQFYFSSVQSWIDFWLKAKHHQAKLDNSKTVRFLKFTELDELNFWLPPPVVIFVVIKVSPSRLCNNLQDNWYSEWMKLFNMDSFYLFLVYEWLTCLLKLGLFHKYGFKIYAGSINYRKIIIETIKWMYI